MTSGPKPKSSRVKVRDHRRRLREQGLRPIQIWVPDVRSPAFRAEARRQSLAVAASPHAREDQAFVDFDFRLASGILALRMRRGEVWTVAGAGDYAGKPRPVVIVQDDSFEGVDLLVVCPFTSDTTEAPLFRLPVEPNPGNGLRAACRLMVDKVTPVPKSKMGRRIGSLDAADIIRLNRSILVFLGLAASSRAR